jgi:hypothetical protein
MLTMENLLRGEGNIVEDNPLIGLRKRTSQSDNMASEEGLSQDEKELLILLQVQVLNPMQRNMFINIRMKCHY